MQLSGITKPGVYVRNGRLYIVWPDNFGKLRHTHIAYVEEDGTVSFCKPNIGLRLPIGHIEEGNTTLVTLIVS